MLLMHTDGTLVNSNVTNDEKNLALRINLSFYSITHKVGNKIASRLKKPFDLLGDDCKWFLGFHGHGRFQGNRPVFTVALNRNY